MRIFDTLARLSLVAAFALLLAGCGGNPNESGEIKGEAAPDAPMSMEEYEAQQTGVAPGGN